MANASLREQRLCIKISVKKGHTLKEAVEDCRSTYGEDCGSYYFIRHWFKRFQLGHNSPCRLDSAKSLVQLDEQSPPFVMHMRVNCDLFIV